MEQGAVPMGDTAVPKGGVLGMSRGIQGRLPGNRSPFAGFSSWYLSTTANVCKGMLVSPSLEHLGSKSFAVLEASTENFDLFSRSSTKVRAEMGYEITGPFPW